MSLYKQLWIAISILMLIAFAGSFMVSTVTVINNVEQQLRIKNIDNANNLALAATQLAGDSTMVEMLIRAQFDNGHYQFIRWLAPDGEIKLDLHRPPGNAQVPDWFKRVIDIEAPSGVAEVQAGWLQLGSLHLQSDTAFAYAALWDNSKRLALYFCVAIVASGVLGHILLHIITHPLLDVVKQSQAMRERRFTKVTPPRTREFRHLVNAMNELSDDVKAFFSKEASQLQRLQEEHRTDPLTGIAGREHFLKTLTNTLIDHDLPDQGILIFLRIRDLQALNRIHDRQHIDSMLANIGLVLNKLCQQHPNWLAGRLNGSDYAVLAPGSSTSDCRDIHQAVLACVEQTGLDALIPAAFYRYHSGEKLGALLSHTDTALAVAETRDGSTLEEADNHSDENESLSPEHWRSLLKTIIGGQAVELVHTALVSRAGTVQHYRPALRYVDNGRTVGHRKLFSWAARLGYSIEMDQLLVERIVAQTKTNSQPLALTLSSQSLMDETRLTALLTSLSTLEAENLQFHIPEYLATEHLEHFRMLCKRLKSHSYKIGLVNAGQHLEKLAKIYDCGINYIVLDSSIVFEINQSKANQTIARSMATMFHSIGTDVYANGITNRAEWDALIKLGIDGGSGSYIEKLMRANNS